MEVRQILTIFSFVVILTALYISIKSDMIAPSVGKFVPVGINNFEINTNIAVDAWGDTSGWGSCLDMYGGTASADIFCKCMGYDGVQTTNACYKEFKSNRYKWNVNSANCTISFGNNTGKGLAVTKIRCYKKIYEIINTPFSIDAWGNGGWDSCDSVSGLVYYINMYCKCNGYKGVYNNGTGACYKEWLNNRYRWSIDNQISCMYKMGNNTGAGLAVTKIKCAI